MVKSTSKWSLCLVCYVLLLGISLGQDPESIIDLDQVADLLKFPRYELVITNYFDQEKFIYTKKPSTEEQRGQMPPVDPNSIYQSYWIASKTPNAFLPIIITLSKPNAYLTPEVIKIIEDYNTYASTLRAKDDHFPYGDFKLLGASYASVYFKNTRVPAHSKQIIEPGDTWTRLDEYPKFHPAIVSIVRDAASEVDIRITQYTCLYDPEILVKVPGGDEYFAAFNDDPEDNPKENPILNIFKGLNQIVLTSPIMNPYRKTPAPPNQTPEPPKEAPVKPAQNPAVLQQLPTPSLQPLDTENSPSNLKIISIILILLGLLVGIVFKICKKRI
jgi:hypothetical protein